MLGRLVVRSLDRADRVQRAMLARGWTGRMPE
ncbi:MAG: CbiQ family ECF transporter T component [Planctomycetaceae bacterium]